MTAVKCESSDFERITEFYKYAIDRYDSMDKFARWKYGQHPTDSMIRQYIDKGYMYYYENGSSIVASFALIPFQEEDYRSVNWSVSLRDDEVCVVHILCVNPDFQRQGIAKEAVKSMTEFAREAGKKAVRLDALCSNKPAQILYEGLGFKKAGVQNRYAENTGWTDFLFYELAL